MKIAIRKRPIGVKTDIQKTVYMKIEIYKRPINMETDLHTGPIHRKTDPQKIFYIKKKCTQNILHEKRRTKDMLYETHRVSQRQRKMVCDCSQYTATP